MRCSRCNSEDSVKNGVIQGRQRYRCKRCGYNYTRQEPRGKSIAIKRLAIHLYLEGLGFRAIGRIVGVSNVAVLKWVRDMASNIEPLVQRAKRREASVIELDEMWHYLQKKRENIGFGLLMIEQGEIFWGTKAAGETLILVEDSLRR